MRVHCGYLFDDSVPPGCFRFRAQDRESANWNKYSTAQQTQGQAARPSENGVIELGVSSVRAIDQLIVEHTPDISRQNRAHTDIVCPGIGTDDEMKTEVRFKLKQIATWVIPVSPCS